MAGWSDRYKSQLEQLTGAGLTGDSTGGVSSLSVMSTFIQAISQIIDEFPGYIQNLQDQIDTLQMNVEALQSALGISTSYIKTSSPVVEIQANSKTYYTKSIGVFNSSLVKNISVFADREIPGVYVDGKQVKTGEFHSFSANDLGYKLTVKTDKVDNIGDIILTLKDASNSDTNTSVKLSINKGKVVVTKPVLPSSYAQSIGKFMSSVSNINAAQVIATSSSYSKSIGEYDSKTNKIK